MDNFNITGWFRNLYLQRLHESEESKLDIAKKEAQRISKEEGVTQHVNKVGNDYKVEDWYDADTTVASYENGRVLNEYEIKPIGPQIKPQKGFEVGNKVKYKGMNHEITRIVDDRIYIKNIKYPNRPDTWVKVDDLKKSLKENLSKEEVKRKDEIYQDLKKDKREFVMRYGKDAEKVMMGRAIEIAKKEIND